MKSATKDVIDEIFDNIDRIAEEGYYAEKDFSEKPNYELLGEQRCQDTDNLGYRCIQRVHGDGSRFCYLHKKYRAGLVDPNDHWNMIRNRSAYWIGDEDEVSTSV